MRPANGEGIFSCSYAFSGFRSTPIRRCSTSIVAASKTSKWLNRVRAQAMAVDNGRCRRSQASWWGNRSDPSPQRGEVGRVER